MTELQKESYLLMKELIEQSQLCEGDLVVVGCSSSEVYGGVIGHDSSYDTATEVFNGIYSAVNEYGLYLAAQCCEHLNRSLVIEKKIALKRGYEIVSVIPQPKAGGSFATNAYRTFEKPVMVENIKAEAGMDIGGTLIGMHLKAVAVPIRLSKSKIGAANIICARTRPKYVGGCRAIYE